MPSEVNIIQRYNENPAHFYDYNAVCSINLFLNQNFTQDRLSNFWKQVKRSFFFLKIIVFGRPTYHFLIKVVGNRHYKLILSLWNKLSWFVKKKREEVIWKGLKEFWFGEMTNYIFQILLFLIGSKYTQTNPILAMLLTLMTATAALCCMPILGQELC